MTPQQFIDKWSNAELRERAASHSHFNDLCALLGERSPTDCDIKGEWYAFERGVSKTGGGEGWADVWKRGCFAWEYKSPGKNLDAALKQLKLYASDLENPPLLIVSDMQRFRIHTNWTNMVQETHELDLDQLAEADQRQKLKWVFDEATVGHLKPSRSANATTEEVAADFVRVALNLHARGHDPDKVAHFVNRMVFCMFAEGVDLLPKKVFERMLRASLINPHEFVANAEALFTAMSAKNGRLGFEAIEWFNGGLFEDGTALPLTREDLDIALDAATKNWSEINPSIMGTLFERGLDPSKRSQLGAHYTDAEKIMMIVRPVIIEPLLVEWESSRAMIAALMETARTHKAKSERTKAANAAADIKSKFIERLKNFRVLDPACGSGNFLYLALKALKDIELRVNFEAESLGLPAAFPIVGPECVRGIEINSFAAELARVSVWIGEIQWMRQHNFSASRNPILKPLNTIECRDALLDHGTEANWPDADVIIGNPPFLGSKFMRKGRPANKRNPAIAGLGAGYVDKLFHAYRGDPPASANFVSYWFSKTLDLMAKNRITRAGLVATQSVRLGASNAPIAASLQSGTTEIYYARQNDEWAIDGAEVRVAIFCFRHSGDPLTASPLLDDASAIRINADLTSGSDTVGAVPLGENAKIAFQGVKQNGPFD